VVLVVKRKKKKKNPHGINSGWSTPKRELSLKKCNSMSPPKTAGAAAVVSEESDARIGFILYFCYLR